MIQKLIKALRLEFVKSRHKKQWLMLLLCAGAFPVLLGFVYFFNDSGNPNASFAYNWFDNIVFRSEYSNVFTILFLPLAISLITANANALEHKNNTWQLIETQPTPKWSIYFAKFFKVLLQVFCVIVLYFFLQYFIQFLIYYSFAMHNTQVYLAIEWTKLLSFIFNFFFGAFSFTAFLFVLHVNISKTNIITSIALVSIIGYLISMNIFQNIPKWLPMVQLDKVSGGMSEVGEWITYYARLSVVQGLFILTIGYGFYYFKNYKRNVWSNKKAAIGVIALFVTTCFVSMFLSTPRIQKSYGKTIIAGKIKADINIKTLALYNKEYLEITNFPINDDGTFYLSLENMNIPLTNYMLYHKESMTSITGKYNFSNQNKYFFMGNGDSIYIDAFIAKDYNKVIYRGDRRAESSNELKYSDENIDNIAIIVDRNEYKKSSAELVVDLQKAYHKDVKSGGKTTIDGYTFAPDAHQRKTVISNIFVLEIWEQYCKKNGNEDLINTIEFPFLNYIRDDIKLEEVSLTDEPIFVNYYFKHLSKKHEVKDIEKIELIEQIENTQMKEVMRFIAVKKIINNYAIEDSLVFAIYNNNLNHFSEEKYKKELNSNYHSRKAKTNFDILPDFAFEDADGNKRSLKEFLGKYIVLDLWSTTCMPCKINAPYFYDFADKYRDKNIQFIAISFDTNIENWKLQKTSNKNIENWLSKLESPFVNHFAVNGIPRFILISPEGTPILHNMPFPEEPAFETMLLQNIKQKI